MDLWNQLSPLAQSSGALSAVEELLRAADVTASVSEVSAPRLAKRLTATWSPTGGQAVRLDPSTGRFSTDPAVTTGDPRATPLEFPEPVFQIQLDLDIPAPGADPTGPFTLTLTVPRAVVRLPLLRGAMLDPTGMLVEDPANPDVRFTLPRLVLESRWNGPGSGPSLRLASATTTTPTAGATDPADIYEFVRMEPAYALVGPGAVVGFAFRTAVLDLSGETTPPGSPALGAPGDWQGFWLPEARLFVAPSGLEGLAVSGGVRDLWVGIGAHAGVTGLFELEMVNRQAAPTMRVRFQDADGRWYAGDTDTVSLPETTTVFVDAAGRAPLDYAIRVGGGAPTASDRAGVTTPSAGAVTIQVTVTDSLSRTTTRSITATRRTTTPVHSGATGPRQVHAETTSGTGSRVVIVSQTGSAATVRLEPEGGDVAWTWPGGSDSGATATIPVASGTAPTSVAVTATRTRAAGTSVELDCYFLLDHPRQDEDATSVPFLYSDNPANTRTRPALPDGSGFLDGEPFQGATTQARLAALPAGTALSVDGFASFDGAGNDPARNLRLSTRRRDALVHVLSAMVPAGITVTAATAHGDVPSQSSGQPRHRFWRATARTSAAAETTETVTATLVRPPETTAPAGDVDPAPSRAPVPECFRKLGARVELVRGTFVRAEVYGEFDVQTAAEDQLSRTGTGTIPPRTNPDDGVCTFLVRLRIQEDRSRWDVSAEFRAVEADTDGLAKLTRPTSGATTGVDVLGALAVLAPLLATATPPSPDEGELVALAVATGAVITLGAAGVISTQSVVLRGGELVVTDGPEGTSVTVMLDLEASFSFDLILIQVPPDRPVSTRYQAVGIRTRWNTPAAGTLEWVPQWAFDPSRGFELDIPAGALVAREPFGDLLRALGMRVSRDNPTYLEVEVGIGADLGIVAIDTVRVRLRLDEEEIPQITAFGASVDVPGVLHGSGYLSLPPGGGVTGFIDMTVVPLGVRVAGALKIEAKDGVTGVFIGLEVEFPVPILLGQSGLGIFGFLGGVGVNMKRLEPTGVPVPALRWLEQQMARPLGVLNPAGWGAQPGAYAFVAGMLVGTVEGGYVLHLKGIVILELPGPRLLLVMKADVLKAPPGLRGSQSATFLAVLDIDFGRGTITIGIVAEYDVVELLHVRIPITAFFDTQRPADWFVDLGSFTEPVTVKVFELFEGTGYVMVHGNGIAHPRFPTIVTSGLTIAAGFHVQFVWGSTSVGLYLKVAGGFDAIVSFKPFALGGIVELSGELRLFIISIGASARLDVLAGRGVVGGVEVERTWVKGEVCGKVDFFFFSVKGCVSLELGDDGVPDPVPPDLVAGVCLVSRSPALVEGSGSDRAVDGKLGDARELHPTSGAPVDAAAVDPPEVPLDAIPVVLFDVPVSQPAGFTVLGGVPGGHSGLGAQPWIRRGRRWWRYEVTGVDLVGALSSGPRPATWWGRGNPADPQHGPALALLSWVPDPTPRAVPYGERLRETVTRRWGTVCLPSASPSPVLWTFQAEPVGPSDVGWVLEGVPWPDDPDHFRSTATPVPLLVTERWRCGDAEADLLRGIEPARVIGDAVPCLGEEQREGEDPLEDWMVGQPLTASRSAALEGGSDVEALSEMVLETGSLADVRAAWVERSWDPELSRRPLACTGKVLRSPWADGPESVPAGDPDDVPTVEKAWQDRRFKSGDLLDVVRLDQRDGLRELTVLLLVPQRFVRELLVLRFLDASDGVISEQRVGGGDVVGPARPLPPRWRDPGGPWAGLVDGAGRMAARVAASQHTSTGPSVLALVRCDLPGETTVVEIGWDPQLRPDGSNDDPPPFHVVAAEGLSVAEISRHDWDASTVVRDREVLTTALTQDPDDHALLQPGVGYQVRVTWRAASVEQDGVPSASTTPAWGADRTQVFRFSAQGVSQVPTRLEPWVLATAPAAEETGTFCDEHVRLAFAHGAVDRLFAAYGQELRLRVRSASGRHPVAAGQSDAAAFLLPFAAASEPTGLVVHTPWEEAAREVAERLSCIPSVGQRVDHRVTDTLFSLEPSTDYLLDVLRVPVGAPASADGERVMRVGFTTSRFSGVEQLASLLRDAVVEHRYLRERAPIESLPENPAGELLDAAFTAAGLGVPQVPRYPRVQVLWTGDVVPQPVAVVVECNEALWRSRPMPTHISEPPGVIPPEWSWWAARPADWLALEPTAAPAAAGDPPRAPVTRVVRGPGGTRAVVLLGPGARGGELRLSLRRLQDPLAGQPDQVVDALRVRLAAAPWEEEI